MMRSVKELYGEKLGVTDGEIGHVKDFYFDDQNWVVRYVVADTASWLEGRLVLISPHAFGDFSGKGDCLPVNLSRKQIENSPSIDAHKPVSRQYEEEYYRYYGWPSYWDGGAMGVMGGVGGFPVVPQPSMILDKEAEPASLSREGSDPHLRSTQHLNGYHIQAGDDEIGHVSDFIMDDKNWAICYLLVQTGHWYAGKEIAISPANIDRISYEDSKVFVNITKEAILDAPEYHVPPPGIARHEAVGNRG